MNDFDKRDIFVNLPYLKQATKRYSIYLICFLSLVLSGIIFVQEARFILWFLFFGGLIGFIGLWISFFKNQRNYQTIPHLILDENGLTINENGETQVIRWQEVVMIDSKVNNLSGRRKIYHAIDTANREYILNHALLADKFDETLVLLKCYAEKYGTAKFIY